MLPLIGLTLGLGALQVQGPAPAIKLVDDPKGQAFVLTVGPMDLPAMHGEHHDMHMAVLPPVSAVRIPHDAFLYGFDYEIRDRTGHLLPRTLLHHLNITDPGHRELFLPIAHRVVAIGSETGPQSMPWMLFGHPLTQGEDLLVSAMLHNPTDQGYGGVTLTLLLKYVPASRPWPFFTVYTWQLDVAFPAGDKSFDVPPGHFTRSYEAKPAMAGRIVVIAGHLHPYATSLKFEDVTEGRLIWEGKPIVSKPGAELEGVTMGRLYWKLGQKITPYHTYRVTVTYDNTTGQTLPDGGMGVVGGLFIPSGTAPWPVADTGGDLYQMDLMHYRRELQGKYADILAQFKKGVKPKTGMTMMDMPGMEHHR
jgi:hypothetical protein